MKRIIVALTLWLAAAQPALAAPPAAPARAKAVRAVGVLRELHDGEVVLLVPSTPEQRAQLTRIGVVEGALPSTPGQATIVAGEVYVRYQLGKEALASTAARYLGKAVILELGLDRKVVDILASR